MKRNSSTNNNINSNSSSGIIVEKESREREVWDSGKLVRVFGLTEMGGFIDWTSDGSYCWGPCATSRSFVDVTGKIKSFYWDLVCAFCF